MTKPKRQRTIRATIKDPESEMKLFPTIRITANAVEFRGGIVAGPDPGVSEWWNAFIRMRDRADRLGYILQRRWFGTVTP